MVAWDSTRPSRNRVDSRSWIGFALGAFQARNESSALSSTGPKYPASSHKTQEKIDFISSTLANWQAQSKISQIVYMLHPSVFGRTGASCSRAPELISCSHTLPCRVCARTAFASLRRSRSVTTELDGLGAPRPPDMTVPPPKPWPVEASGARTGRLVLPSRREVNASPGRVQGRVNA